MENNIQIVGNSDEIIYYNLNKQFSNVKKIIITKDIIFDAFETNEFKDLIYELKSGLPNEYLNAIKEGTTIFEDKLKNELYSQIQEALQNLSANYMDVKLDNYNFMSSISNSKFTITLRTEHFSITNYYVEKGTILSNIKHLLKDYLNFTGNIYRLPRLDIFQIEIYESEEIYKSIYLKKENDAIILASTYGFPKNNPIDYSIGHEFYTSKGNDFKFYKNKQTNAILREYNKLLDKEINSQEKVLESNELILINEKTSGIDDAFIECYINSKGQLRINNLSVIENSIQKYSENGIILNKSSNNYDRIAILSLRDDFDEETVNPKYLLLKNEGDIKEFMSDIRIVDKIDGLIITKNFYNKFLDRLGKNNNLDIIYIENQISKSLDEKLNIENISVSSQSEQKSGDNPFSSIIKDQNKEKDELLEKLKNIDLSTPSKTDMDYRPRTNIENNKNIENVVNNIIGSEHSSFRNSEQDSRQMMGNNNEKKSAFDFLMDSAKAQERKNAEVKSGNMAPQQQSQPQPNQYSNQQNSYNQEQQNQNMNYNQQNIQQEPQRHLNEFTNYNNQPQTTSEVRETVTLKEDIRISQSVDISKYESVLATEIICEPGSQADAYFVDINTISEVQSGKIYFLTLNPEDMQNPNLNYVLPIGLNNPNVKKCSLLIKNVNDFFLIDENQDVEYFVNINDIHDIIKKSFIEQIINRVGTISLICNKKDLDLIEEIIDRINAIRVRDIENEYDLGDIKRKLLSFEKRKLMNN